VDRHLALNAAVPAEYPRTTLVVGSKVLERLGPVENAGEILATLIRYYFVGLNRPLKFFPRTTWEYARALWRDGKSRPDALWAAASAWQGDEYSLALAEGDDPACGFALPAICRSTRNLKKRRRILREASAGL
jgi:exodeoxyribonuclease V gamma subunit